MGLVTFLFILHHAQALEFPRYKEECSANYDCFDDYEYCNAGLEDAVCYHKEPYPNIYPSEWLGYIAIFFMMIFSSVIMILVFVKFTMMTVNCLMLHFTKIMKFFLQTLKYIFRSFYH